MRPFGLTAKITMLFAIMGVLGLTLLLVAAEFGWIYRAHQIGMKVEPIHTRILQMASFAGSLEIAMMAPVVFLVLPVTVLFAFWPGLVGLSLTVG